MFGEWIISITDIQLSCWIVGTNVIPAAFCVDQASDWLRFIAVAGLIGVIALMKIQLL